MAARYDESRAWYEKAIAGAFQAEQHSMVDDEIWIWKAPLNMATTYVKEGRIEEAVPWFERAQANKPESPVLRGLVASAYERVGRFYDAERMFREAAERDGDAGFSSYVNYLMRRRRFFEAFDRVEQRRDAIDDRSYAALLTSAAQTRATNGSAIPNRTRCARSSSRRATASRWGCWSRCTRRAARRRSATRCAAPSWTPRCASRRTMRAARTACSKSSGSTKRWRSRAKGSPLAPHDGVLAYNAGLAAARAAPRRRSGRAPRRRRARRRARHVRARAAGGDPPPLPAISTLRSRRSNACARCPRPTTPALRHATLGLATALLEAGRVADAGKLAALVLS